MGDSFELIGKRLLLLLDDGRTANGTEPQQAALVREWLRGTVRAVRVVGLPVPESSGTKTTTSHPAGLTVFVEFENASKRCSWVQVFDSSIKAALVEDSIVWTKWNDTSGNSGAPATAVAWPALLFRSLVDKTGLGSIVAVEHFGNKKLEFLPDKKSVQRFETDKDMRHPLMLEQSALHAAVSSWRSDFELQEIFRKGSYTIQGCRVCVYQPESDECWAPGLISHHDPVSHIVEITMDKSKENQMLDPRVVHIKLAENEPDMNGQRSETIKCDGGRRRRTASEGEDDVNLKRFKGAGNLGTDGQDCSESNRTPTEGSDGWSGAVVSSTTKNGSNSEGNFLQSRVLASNTSLSLQTDQSNSSSPRFPSNVNENGRTVPTQGTADSTTAASHTLNPPPLKPAPSPFSSTSFPSLGQMPSLVPGTPSPKAPQADRQEALQSPLSKPSTLVSPGPVTISWTSHDSSPSVAVSTSVGFNPKAPSWGGQAEASKSSLGFGLASSAAAAPVFGNVSSKTNGTPTTSSSSQEPSKPFGFGFGEAKNETQTQNDKNLFFQCMTQSSGSSPVRALSQNLSSEPANLFKHSNEGLKTPDQYKKPESHPTGNGLFIKPSSVFQGVGGSAPGTHSSAVGMATASGAQSSLQSSSNGTTTAGLGLQPGAAMSDSHQNLFLQASKKPANPFPGHGDSKTSHTPFSGFSVAESPNLTQPSDGNANLFTMAEPPKGICSSSFPTVSTIASTSSSSPSTSSSSLRPQSEGSQMGGQDSQEMPSSTSGSMFGSAAPGGPNEVPMSFDQSQTQKFMLEERAQSSKRDSESSSNSDLSDLSENEEGLEKGQIPGQLQHTAKDALMLQKAKVQGAPKSRPRNKPFKAGQSVLKDQSKVRRLKQSGESFLQDGSCINVAPHLHKCRECRLERYRKYRSADEDSDDEDDPNVACRFFHFRRLAFTRKGILRVEGFLSPQQSDAMAMGLWLPAPAVQEGLDLDTSKYILANVGDQFCQLVMSEKEAMMMVEPHQKVAWKRAVRGVREMCDVCETTLFNIHWVCRKCGFGVCLDCYRLRRNRPREDIEEIPEDDVFSWLKCAKGQPHEPQNLMPTQIIPGTALYNIGDMVHSARGKWGIKANCPCTSRHTKPLMRSGAPNGISQSNTNSSGSSASTPSASSLATAPAGVAAAPKTDGEPSAVKTEGAAVPVSSDSAGGESVGSTSNSTSGTSSPSSITQPSAKESRASGEGNSSALHWLADLATQKAKDDTKETGSLRSMMSKDCRPPFGLDSLSALSKPSASSPKLFNSLLLGSSMAQSKPEGSSLRDLLNSGPGKLSQGPGESGVPFPSVFISSGSDKMKSSLPNFLDHIIASVVETKKAEGRRTGQSEGGEIGILGGRKEGVMGLSVLEPHTSHSWLCDGRLLCLQDPRNSNNWKIFRECWKQGQPVLVSGIHKRLKSNLWLPEAFSEEFGNQDVDLVNCRNCAIISDVKVRDFWDGFQVISKRLRDPEGQPMVLKLKDWPPGEDFRDMMPTRFDDLMDNLPLPEYTKRDGRLNLAARLPNFFVRPDLGPKMYNAYGLTSTEDRKVGTTNLHLDVSDAVNVMVYVGIPQGEGDQEKEKEISGHKEVMITIEEGDVDEVTKRRVYVGKENPGALWHIYAAKDAEKIRELLRKVGEEQGQENPPDHDPIHDQSWYLDQTLRRRLYEEYGVQGWAIVQFLGDAVFIPAGAPHQVHNLYSCIKVAEDFVSPEHVRHCFRLTQEFRHLSTTHTNHEDKLQVKNIIYHAVKDAVGTLKAHEPKLARP
ncbi:lysine-specific demethylase 3B isoform 1-T1 [Synchiropus picturatus]